MTAKQTEKIIERGPVIVVMGHIDHGKSTLLDYIRKANVTENEAGGITQHISAYEVIHKDDKGVDRKITFLDTPGHEAFSEMRERGARIADIAILIVSAEDGVKPQTKEAWQTISLSKTPVIVAINKIDRPGANIEKVKIELAENEIYLEGYGGNVPVAMISAKTGEGIDDLLSLINILAELENFTGDPTIGAKGYVLEASMDPRRGISGTLIIKDGKMERGMFVASQNSLCPVRMMEDFLGKPISEARFSSPVRLIGFDSMPEVGSEFMTFETKKQAEEYIEKNKKNQGKITSGPEAEKEESKKVISIVLKADVLGSLEAIQKEIQKIKSPNAEYNIISAGAGPIGEKDIEEIGNSENCIVLGFNVKTDRSAVEIAESRNLPIMCFDIIYKMTEWLTEELERRRPKIETLEVSGRARILKTFSKTKERQILGGKMEEGKISLGNPVKILRRDFEIGRGKIVNLESSKQKVSAVESGTEFGMMIESKIEIAPGDFIESFLVTQK